MFTRETIILDSDSDDVQVVSSLVKPKERTTSSDHAAAATLSGKMIVIQKESSGRVKSPSAAHATDQGRDVAQNVAENVSTAIDEDGPNRIFDPPLTRIEPSMQAEKTAPGPSLPSSRTNGNLMEDISALIQSIPPAAPSSQIHNEDVDMVDAQTDDMEDLYGTPGPRRVICEYPPLLSTQSNVKEGTVDTTPSDSQRHPAGASSLNETNRVITSNPRLPTASCVTGLSMMKIRHPLNANSQLRRVTRPHRKCEAQPLSAARYPELFMFVEAAVYSSATA